MMAKTDPEEAPLAPPVAPPAEELAPATMTIDVPQAGDPLVGDIITVPNEVELAPAVEEGSEPGIVYIGTADIKRFRVSDLAANNVEATEDLVWRKAENTKIPVSSLSDSALQFLTAQPDLEIR